MNVTANDQIVRRGYWADAGMFVRSWVRTPGRTGAVLPSSRRLANAMTHEVKRLDAPVVAELGPGTGAITAGIQGVIGAGRHIAVELNPKFAGHLTGWFPNVDVVNDSATELVKILDKRGIETVDAVISGLPFAAFPRELQNGILDAVVMSLGQTGVFVTFNYVGAYSLPAGRRFRKLIEERFSDVSLSRAVMMNIPPAFVMTARGPKK